MMINLAHPAILDLFPEHIDPKRSESAAFLIWYLEHYYRLDSLEAVDSVCDNSGDKGVDGIYVNDNDMTITVFQSRISQSADRKIGDASLREFSGTLSQFKDSESIANLVESGGSAAVSRLAELLDVESKINTHELRGEFLTNIDIDFNGSNFLEGAPEINFVGKSQLINTYISDERTLPVQTPANFDIVGFHTTDYTVDKDTKSVIAPIKSTELVNLTGIADQSLFAFNVRGPLGRTQVNRDIIKSIKDPSKHRLFPLFHNGITIICQKLESTPELIAIDDYFVVNGCQSLNSLYENQTELTDDLRILVKFIKMDVNSPLSEMVTRFSNNQNGVKSRDFKANNPIQIRLQNEFQENYTGRYSFEIKRGETSGPGHVVSNEDAGLYLMAFDLREPWATHRKYQVFEDKHAEVFARPEVTAHRIVLCQVMVEAIQESLGTINNSLFAKYVLTKYLILYIVRMILDNDELASDILSNPGLFVHGVDDCKLFKVCIGRVVNDIIIDINGEVDEYGEDFDYRGRLRDADWVKELSRKVCNDYLKLVSRGRIESFSVEWKNGSTC